MAAMNETTTQRMHRTATGWACDFCGEAANDWSHRCPSQAASPKPEPAVGQIWQTSDRNPCGTISRVRGGVVEFGDGDEVYGATMVDHGSRWRCVGIETPAGRVMVGERRWPDPELDFEVHHILSDGRVWVTDGVEGYAKVAAAVAAWPLVPGPPAKAAESAVRSSGQWTHNLTLRASPMTAERAEALSKLVAAHISMIPLPTVPPDPRIAREQRRREIDAALREDARRFPAFATARRAALLCALEDSDVTEADVGRVPQFIAALHKYEADRGGLTTPRTSAATEVVTGGADSVILAHYERARGMA